MTNGGVSRIFMGERLGREGVHAFPGCRETPLWCKAFPGGVEGGPGAAGPNRRDAALGSAVSRVKGQECGRCARIQVVPRISGGSPAGMAAEAARVSFALNQIGSGRFFCPEKECKWK